MIFFVVVVQMAKKMKKLEKECQSWKTRFDGCNKNLIDMVADVRIFCCCFNSLIPSYIDRFKKKKMTHQGKNSVYHRKFYTIC